MRTAVAARTEEGVAFRSAEELREVLDRLLESVDSNDRLGPIFRASHARTRLEFTDLDQQLNVASTADDPRHCLRWSFAKRAPWPPKLEMQMSSAVANSYLQGRDSLPVLIARRRVRCSCESRAALLFLPAAKLLVKPYLELIESDYEHLLLT